MTAWKILLLAMAAVIAALPVSASTAKHSAREKSRAHKTRNEKSARHSSSSSKSNDKHHAKSSSERDEFEQRWDVEQVEPELPESE